MEEIPKIISKLREKNFIFNTSNPLYNPLEEFVEYVSTKEIIHSRILEDILRENGHHGLGNRFISTFLKQFLDINYSELAYVSIEREKKVPRQVTDGDDRSIDIFIEYAYAKDLPYRTHESAPNSTIELDKTLGPIIKNAIIIENKLNNAYYQDKQLLDYYRATQEKGYQRIDVICLHKYKGGYDNEIENLDGYKPIIKYPKDLASWLSNSITIFDLPKVYTLISYITLLNNINAYNSMKENIDILFNLDKQTFQEVKAVAEAYNGLMKERLAVLLSKDWLPKFCPKATAKYKSRTDNIEIWNERDYKRNHLFIVLWKRVDGFSLYLASDNPSEAINKYVIKANYKEITDNDYGYKWFMSEDNGNHFFEYPQKDGIERMMIEVKRLLEILAE